MTLSAMSLGQPPANTAANLSPPPTSMPARRAPAPGGWRLFRQVLQHGGPGYVQFAITNLCNARCDFCNFAVDRLPAGERRSVTLEEARLALDIMARNQVGYVLFVGGEPMVHPDLLAMTRHATELGIRAMICTNGSRWTEENLRAFADAGLAGVIMSIDTHDAARHEANRGLPNVCRKIQQANAFFKSRRIPTTGSVTASRLIENYERLPVFLRELGFDACTFSYPLAQLKSSYLSFSDSGLVRYTPEELIEVYERIRQLKGNPHCPVINPGASLEDMQRHVRQQPERFPCLGGFKYFYLDWRLQLYRCHFWEHPMCHITEFDASRLIRDGCTRCMIDCYRDSSVMQFPAISLHDAWQSLKQGRLLRAASHLLDRRNFVAAAELWKNRHFIGGV